MEFQETANLRSHRQEVIESKEENSKLQVDCLKKTEVNKNLSAQVDQLTEVRLKTCVKLQLSKKNWSKAVRNYLFLFLLGE